MLRTDLYQKVTDRIVAELESGAVPWLRPWAPTSGAAIGADLPCNATTRKRYRGVNVWLLWADMADAGYSVPLYLTFNQCKAAGGMVRKGEHGCKVYFFKKLDIPDRRSDDPEARATIPLLREYTVFNVAQCDGLPASVTAFGKSAIPVSTGPVTTIEPGPFEAMVAATGAKVHHGGDRAYYTTGGDYIQMPLAAQFRDASNYRATLAHELVHWSGHESRLNRDLKHRFGTQAYAAEELIAELGAAFLAAMFGIEGDLRHAGYIESWIKMLKDDKRAIFTASSKAQAAVDYLAPDAIEEDEESEVPLAACSDMVPRLRSGHKPHHAGTSEGNNA